MRTKTILVAVLVAALSVAPSAQDRPAALSGSVVDAITEHAIPADVTVIMETAAGTITESVDASQGSFGLEDLPAGLAIVYAVTEGYSPGWTEVSLPVDREQPPVRLGLELEAALSGTVLDRRGEALRGAFVRTTYPDEAGAYGLLDNLTYGQRITNADGEFDLFGLIADTTVTLQAETEDGALSDTVTVDTFPGMANDGIVLQVP